MFDSYFDIDLAFPGQSLQIVNVNGLKVEVISKCSRVTRCHLQIHFVDKDCAFVDAGYSALDFVRTVHHRRSPRTGSMSGRITFKKFLAFSN